MTTSLLGGFAECTTEISKMVLRGPQPRVPPPPFSVSADSKGVRNTDFVSADCKGLSDEVRNDGPVGKGQRRSSGRREETENKADEADSGGFREGKTQRTGMA